MAGNRPLSWWITALAGGLLAGFALPPLGCPPLLWMALLPLWGLGPAAAALWGAAAVLVSHRWLLWLHPLDWVGVPLPLSLPLCVALWLGCGLLAALLVALWRLLVERLGPDRWGTALLAAALWGLAEIGLARGPLFWIGLGSASLPGDPALAGLARLLGAGGLAALQLLIAWGLWRGFTTWRRQRSARWLGAWLLLVLALHGIGLQQLAVAAPAGDGPWRRVLVLQPAVPTRRKFEAQQQQLLLQRLAAAQSQAERLRADSVLLPEGALALEQPLPRSSTVEVLSGGFRLDGDQLRSALLRFVPGEQTPSSALDKHRLVPLGEWIPGGAWLRWAGLSAVGGVEPGPASRLMRRDVSALGVAICYELADGLGLMKASRDGARWLLASANLDPYPAQLQEQFAALAQLRAIESGRWLVSAANTGPSLVVDPGGVVRERMPAGHVGTALMRLQERSELTAYGRWGEAPLLLLGLSGTAVLLVSRVRQSRR